MITIPRVLIPQHSQRENHGLLIYFLKEYYGKSEDSQEFLNDVNIVLCEKCDVRGIGIDYEIHNECDGCNTDDISLECALEYVSKQSLEVFKSYSPRDQFKYIEKVYRTYEYYWPMNRSNVNNINFCNGCNCVWISTSALDDDIYPCWKIGCGTTYCENCTLRGNFLSHLESNFSRYGWHHNCTCRKHNTLFDALYTILFLEK
jgi:hypothetical protein